jgi:hypothetical protein
MHLPDEAELGGCRLAALLPHLLRAAVFDADAISTRHPVALDLLPHDEE